MSTEVRLVILFVLTSALAICSSCSSSSQPNEANISASPSEKDNKKKKGDKEIDQQRAANTDNTSADLTCDKSLWDRVYNPDRLEVQTECKTVTGTIAERNTDEDGDEHMLLKLDDRQDDLLTKRTKRRRTGISSSRPSASIRPR